MRQHVHIASRRRDERLAMVRKLTLWITGGAAAASLGLGTAFAGAVPGHASGTTTPGTTTTTTPASSAAPSNAGSGSSSPAAPRPAASRPASTQHSQPQTQLQQPAQQPTHTAAPPVVTSGGS